MRGYSLGLMVGGILLACSAPGRHFPGASAGSGGATGGQLGNGGGGAKNSGGETSPTGGAPEGATAGETGESGAAGADGGIAGDSSAGGGSGTIESGGTAGASDGTAGKGGTGAGGTGAGGTGAGGTAGKGGTAGAGGSSAGAPGAPLGSACAKSNECASTYCSDGVCCDQACTGPCTQCNSAGKCSAPQDDSACPVVSCAPGTNECLVYATDIASNRCLSVGVCKSATNCGSSPKPAQTACNTASSDVALCNSSGTCTAPVVKCGGVDCAIGSKVCCSRRSGSTTSQTCDEVANCQETPFDAVPASTPTKCDEHTDCRTGYLCSLVSASGGSEVYCRLVAQANVHGSVANWYEVCQSPVKTNTCSGGRTCTETADSFPGWKFCAHLASD